MNIGTETLDQLLIFNSVL